MGVRRRTRVRLNALDLATLAELEEAARLDESRHKGERDSLEEWRATLAKRARAFQELGAALCISLGVRSGSIVMGTDGKVVALEEVLVPATPDKPGTENYHDVPPLQAEVLERVHADVEHAKRMIERCEAEVRLGGEKARKSRAKLEAYQRAAVKRADPKLELPEGAQLRFTRTTDERGDLLEIVIPDAGSPAS